jgi:hypothetical protein
LLEGPAEHSGTQSDAVIIRAKLPRERPTDRACQGDGRTENAHQTVAGRRDKPAVRVEGVGEPLAPGTANELENAHEHERNRYAPGANVELTAKPSFLRRGELS